MEKGNMKLFYQRNSTDILFFEKSMNNKIYLFQSEVSCGTGHFYFTLHYEM